MSELFWVVVVVVDQQPLCVFRVGQPPTYVDQDLLALKVSGLLYVKDDFAIDRRLSFNVASELAFSQKIDS